MGVTTLKKFTTTTKLTKKQLTLLGPVDWSTDPKYLTKDMFLDVMGRLDNLQVDYNLHNRVYCVTLSGRLRTCYNGIQHSHPIHEVCCGKTVGYSFNRALDKYLGARKRIISAYATSRTEK